MTVMIVILIVMMTMVILVVMMNPEVSNIQLEEERQGFEVKMRLTSKSHRLS